MRLTRAMRLAPTISLDFSRSNARGRSDLHGRPKRMKAPEHCKIGAGRTQRQGSSDRTASLASKRPVARGSASGSTGLTGRVRAPGRAFTIRICQMWRELSAHKASPYQYATNASLRLDGRELLAPCASRSPHRFTSRGRMRGVGATCTGPTTHGRPKRIRVPECCKIGAA